MGQGSTANVIAALASFFLPGLGQLLQGRPLMALAQFMAWGFSILLCFIVIGCVLIPLAYLWTILDAALFRPDTPCDPRPPQP